MLFRQRLDRLEDAAATILRVDGVAPRVTTGTSEAVVSGAALSLDVTAQLRSWQQSPMLGLARVEFWLTAQASNANSSDANGWTNSTLDYAWTRLLARVPELPELGTMQRGDRVTVSTNEAGGSWYVVMRDQAILEIQMAGPGGDIIGIVANQVTQLDPGALAARAQSQSPQLFVSPTLLMVGEPIPVHWASALDGDDIELVDEALAVVDTTTATEDGPGTFDFPNSIAGTFSAQIRRAAAVIQTSISETVRFAPQGV